MDMIRDLLLAIEADPQFDGVATFQPEVGELGITEGNFRQVGYHLTLLIEAGFIEGRAAMEMPLIKRLTWNGHEFLEDIRSPEVWSKTKAGMASAGRAGIGFAWEIAKGYGKEYARSLGIPLP